MLRRALVLSWKISAQTNRQVDSQALQGRQLCHELRDVFEQATDNFRGKPVSVLHVCAALLQPPQVIQTADHQECGNELLFFIAEFALTSIALKVCRHEIIKKRLFDLREQARRPLIETPSIATV